MQRRRPMPGLARSVLPFSRAHGDAVRARAAMQTVLMPGAAVLASGIAVGEIHGAIWPELDMCRRSTGDPALDMRKLAAPVRIKAISRATGRCARRIPVRAGFPASLQAPQIAAGRNAHERPALPGGRSGPRRLDRLVRNEP